MSGYPAIRAHHDVCAVVPMYNEASVVADVVRRLLQEFSTVVCVDDGSTDSSATVARFAGAVVVTHPLNLGQGAALMTGIQWGLRNTSAAQFVTFDADGQHRVSDAAAMVAVAQDTRVDVVLGSRFIGRSTNTAVPNGRRVLLRAATAYTRVTTGLSLTDTHNGLRVLSRRFAESLDLVISGMGHASEILSAISEGDWSHVEHPVDISYTEYSMAKGQSNLNAVNIIFDLAIKRLWATT